MLLPLWCIGLQKSPGSFPSSSWSLPIFLQSAPDSPAWVYGEIHWVRLQSVSQSLNKHFSKSDHLPWIVQRLKIQPKYNPHNDQVLGAVADKQLWSYGELKGEPRLGLGANSTEQGTGSAGRFFGQNGPHTVSWCQTAEPRVPWKIRFFFCQSGKNRKYQLPHSLNPTLKERKNQTNIFFL